MIIFAQPNEDGESRSSFLPSLFPLGLRRFSLTSRFLPSSLSLPSMQTSSTPSPSPFTEFEKETTILSSTTNASKGCTRGTTSRDERSSFIEGLWKDPSREERSRGWLGKESSFSFLRLPYLLPIPSRRSNRRSLFLFPFASSRLLDTGPFWGLIMLVIFSVQHLFFYFLEWAFPREEIDYVPLEAKWDQQRMEKVSTRFFLLPWKNSRR